MPVLTLQLTAVQVLALSAFGVAGGIWIKRKLPVLDRLNIPASVVGGLCYALLILLLRDRYLNLEMDLALRDILMVAFFTTVGMSASLRLVAYGGVQMIWFMILATATTIFQNLLGIGLAMAMGMSPLLGLAAGSVSMAGGPATALAFGPTLEKLGGDGATTVGLAAAMFGIVAGGLLGGHVGGSIITRNKLRSSHGRGPNVEELVYGTEKESASPVPVSPDADSQAEHSPLMNSVIAIAIAMGIGSVISLGFERGGLTLPSYVGAMIAAGFIRNLDDKFRFARISQHQVDNIGNIALSLFIVMALLTLRLWELFNLALPLFAILAAEVALVWLICHLVYRAMSRDYDAAVMAGGFCGFMLGTSANALACMQVLVEKFGPAPRAYIVVPLVGAFFIDFTNALVITTMANLFK